MKESGRNLNSRKRGRREERHIRKFMFMECNIIRNVKPTTMMQTFITCDTSYNLRICILLTWKQVCVNCKAWDLESKHTQRLWEICNYVEHYAIIQRKTYLELIVKEINLLDRQKHQKHPTKNKNAKMYVLVMSDQYYLYVCAFSQIFYFSMHIRTMILKMHSNGF